MNTGRVNQAVYRTAMSGSQEKLASLADVFVNEDVITLGRKGAILEDGICLI